MQLVSIAVAVMLVVLHRDAEACDRSPSLLEKLEVGVAAADVVVSGEVTAIADGVATVKVATALKGAPGGEVQLRGATLASEVDRCGGLPIEIGKRYVFLLWAPVGHLTAYHVVDRHGGVLAATTEAAAKQALAAGHPHSAWLVKGDVATMLVLGPSPANSGEVDLAVVLRNIGAKPKKFRSAHWPRQTQTKCTLAITNIETSKRIAAKRVPIAQKDIASYFKRLPTWESSIAPGEAHHLRLFRVTTAKQGWGYKEDLGFVYYPVETPGVHSVRADCANVFGVGTRAATGAMALTL